MELRLKWLAAFVISFIAVGSLYAATGPQFKKQKIELSYKAHKKVLVLDAAETVEQQAYGLMNRKKMAVDDGMIFIFPEANPREFWMKDTLIDLDIAYVGATGSVIDIQNMKAMTSVLQTNLPTYPSKGPALYAIEMNSGWFKKNGFPVGTQLKLLPGLTSKK